MLTVVFILTCAQAARSVRSIHGYVNARTAARGPAVVSDRCHCRTKRGKGPPARLLDIDPGIVAAIPHLIGAQTCFLQRDFKKKRMGLTQKVIARCNNEFKGMPGQQAAQPSG